MAAAIPLVTAGVSAFGSIKSAKTQKKAAEAQAGTANAAGGAQESRDPMANPRRRQRSRTGFSAPAPMLAPSTGGTPLLGQ